MTNDEERALARRIQAELHGAGLKGQSIQATGYVGPGTGIPQAPMDWQGFKPQGPMVLGSVKVQEPAPAYIPDSERMIQYLDKLTDDFRKLGEKAGTRLYQFCGPVRAAKGDNSPAIDNRQCSSPYFRILESRIEMLNESLNYLNDLVDSVSAHDQTGLGTDAKTSW